MSDGVVAGLPSPGNVVFDIDGCLVSAGVAIPGAAATIKDLDRLGVHWLIATNNSTRSAASVAEQLTHFLARPIPTELVLTSADAVAGMLDANESPALVVGEGGLVETLIAGGIAVTEDPVAARSVVVGLDRRFDYELLHRAGRAAASGARLVATNADPTFPHPEGDRPGAGALLAAIEAIAGRKAEVAGKPFEPMRRLIASRLQPGPTWMVGDRASTDLALARAAGWIGVLVLTGVDRDPAAIPHKWRPDLVLESVADLPAALAAAGR